MSYFFALFCINVPDKSYILLYIYFLIIFLSTIRCHIFFITVLYLLVITLDHIYNVYDLRTKVITYYTYYLKKTDFFSVPRKIHSLLHSEIRI